MYRLFLDASIKVKLILIILGISIAVLTLTSVVQLYTGLREEKEKAVNEINIIAQIIANQSTAALQFFDQDAANENLTSVTINDSIVLACIYDIAGDVFAAYLKGRDLETDERYTHCPAVESPGHYFKEEYLYFTHTIQLEEEDIGTIFIKSDLHKIEEYATRYILYTLMLAMMATAVAYMLSTWVQRVISGPISNLVAVMSTILAKKDYSIRASKKNADELGTLVDAFNQMLSHIQDRDTALVTAKQTAEAAQQRAEVANQAKSEFLQNMSHELRTPMHNISAFAGFGVEEVQTEELKREELLDYFKTIQDRSEQMTKLLNNILDITKLEADKISLLVERADVKKLIASVVKELQPEIFKKKITVNMQETAVETIGFFDKQRIRQLIHNIMTNAIRFNNEEGSIAISIEEADLPERDENLNVAIHLVKSEDGGEVEGEKKPGAAIAVSFKDTGVGIPEDELESIFEKFTQSSRTNDGSGGRGLELSICRSIVNAHGGKIWAESNEDSGSTFTFILPLDCTEFIKPEEEEAA